MRTPVQFAAVLLTLASALLGSGCAVNHPRFWHPGTIEQQRLRATIHDPYPDPDLGPNYDGGRPREYQDPLPEPVRNRLYADSWWWRQR